MRDNEVTVDLNRMEHLPKESTYNHKWHEINGYSCLLVDCSVGRNQNDLYIANSLGKIFLFSDQINDDNIYPGPLGDKWT